MLFRRNGRTRHGENPHTQKNGCCCVSCITWREHVVLLLPMLDDGWAGPSRADSPAHPRGSCQALNSPVDDIRRAGGCQARRIRARRGVRMNRVTGAPGSEWVKVHPRAVMASRARYGTARAYAGGTIPTTPAGGVTARRRHGVHGRARGVRMGQGSIRDREGVHGRDTMIPGHIRAGSSRHDPAVGMARAPGVVIGRAGAHPTRTP